MERQSATNAKKRRSIARIKDEIVRKTEFPKAVQHVSNQGEILNERNGTQENNTMKEATLEITLKLQGGVTNDDTMNSARSIEERNMRRKHSEIGDTPISDDPEYIRREIGLASRRSEEVVESLQQKFQTNTMHAILDKTDK